MSAQGYTFWIDEAEVNRFRSMADNAERHEGELWRKAGIVRGATVIDLGCGPGALLPKLAERVGPDGTILAVDADPQACAAARDTARSLDVKIHVIEQDATSTGLPARAADVVMMRNVLVHNGRRSTQLLAHIETLLRDGGHLLNTEPDVAGLDFVDADAEYAYEQRWAAMMRDDGNDPALGRDPRLSQLLGRNGWRVKETLVWTDQLLIDKSPAWAAADTIQERAYATAEELDSWRAAMERRRARGPLSCSLPMTTVLAQPHRSHR